MATRSSWSRRRFLAAAVAASAAVLAPEPSSAAARRRRRATTPPAPAPAPEPTAVEREVARQRQGTLELLRTLRAHALGPGGDLPLVLRTVAPVRRGR